MEGVRRGNGRFGGKWWNVKFEKFLLEGVFLKKINFIFEYDFFE